MAFEAVLFNTLAALFLLALALLGEADALAFSNIFSMYVTSLTKRTVECLPFLCLLITVFGSC